LIWRIGKKLGIRVCGLMAAAVRGNDW